jgi:hypothetical protein
MMGRWSDVKSVGGEDADMDGVIMLENINEFGKKVGVE